MSIKRISVATILIGAIIGIFNWGLDELVIRFNGHGHGNIMFFADMVGGMLASIAALCIMWWARERKLRLLSKIEKVGEINHHIRNALQMIALCNHDKTNAHVYEVLHDAVERIEWTLQEYLPANATPPRLGGDLRPKACWAPTPNLPLRTRSECPLGLKCKEACHLDKAIRNAAPATAKAACAAR